jgi:hypothetical protein
VEGVVEGWNATLLVGCQLRSGDGIGDQGWAMIVGCRMISLEIECCTAGIGTYRD